MITFKKERKNAEKLKRVYIVFTKLSISHNYANCSSLTNLVPNKC